MLRRDDDTIWTLSTQRPCHACKPVRVGKNICVVKMPYEKIDACEKGCVLFRKEYAHLDYCPNCESCRYIVVDNGMGEKRQTKITVSVLRYMPIIPRLQRLFMVEETARQMTWHKLGKRTEIGRASCRERV